MRNMSEGKTLLNDVALIAAGFHVSQQINLSDTSVSNQRFYLCTHIRG